MVGLRRDCITTGLHRSSPSEGRIPATTATPTRPSQLSGRRCAVPDVTGGGRSRRSVGRSPAPCEADGRSFSTAFVLEAGRRPTTPIPGMFSGCRAMGAPSQTKTVPILL